MIDIIKHLEFFNPMDVKESIHIIGLGAIGSHIAEMLARLGLDNFYLYDFDKIESKNVANQMFFAEQVGSKKVTETAVNMRRINPDLQPRVYDGWKDHTLSGYVFLCADNMDVRRKVVEDNLYNNNIKAMFDFRMRLADAQHYAADWSDLKQRKNLLKTMQFSNEEADKDTPVSACGSTLSVLPTIRIITACGVSNFINLVKGEGIRPVILIDAFKFDILTM